jgi:hypothetical protein
MVVGISPVLQLSIHGMWWLHLVLPASWILHIIPLLVLLQLLRLGWMPSARETL